MAARGVEPSVLSFEWIGEWSGRRINAHGDVVGQISNSRSAAYIDNTLHEFSSSLTLNQATAINDEGLVVGYFVSGNNRGFTWSVENGMNEIQRNDQTRLYDVNNHGVIAGRHRQSGSPDPGSEFFRLPGGDLGRFDGSDIVINDQGTVVVWNWDDGLFVDRAGSTTLIGSPVSGPIITLGGINDAEQIAGWGVTLAGVTSSFLYDEQFITLPPLPGYGESIAPGIDGAGRVVGASFGSNGATATLWHEGEAFDLNAIIGSHRGSGHLAEAWDIAANGWVVGNGSMGTWRAQLSFDDIFRWINSGGGSFGLEGNWETNSVPGDEDFAIFDLPDAYTVQDPDATTIAGVRVLDGTVTLNAASMTLVGDPQEFNVLEVLGGSTRLVLPGGANLAVGGGSIALSGHLDVTGGNFTLNNAGSFTMVGDQTLPSLTASGHGTVLNVDGVNEVSFSEGIVTFEEAAEVFILAPLVLGGSQRESLMRVIGAPVTLGEVELRPLSSVSLQGLGLITSAEVHVNSTGFLDSGGIIIVTGVWQTTQMLIGVEEPGSVGVHQGPGGLEVHTLHIGQEGELFGDGSVEILSGGSFTNDGQVTVAVTQAATEPQQFQLNALTPMQGDVVPQGLTIDGVYTQSATGALTIVLEQGDPASLGLHVLGDAEIDGVLQIIFGEGYRLEEGMDLDVLTVQGELTGTFDEIVLGGAFPHAAGTLAIAPEGVSVNITAVPEPGSLALLALGAAGLWRRVRRNTTR